jgi:aminoglycoside 3-N-acetyltransferase I
MRASFSIRRAENIAELHALNVLFGEAFGDSDTYGSPVPADHLHAVLTRPQVIVLVATAGEQIVGGLVAYELQKLERPRSELYLYDLAVAAAHRRRGIATALIERLRAIAAERGCSSLYVQADWDDEAANALYSKLGRSRRVVHFELDLSRD